MFTHRNFSWTSKRAASVFGAFTAAAAIALCGAAGARSAFAQANAAPQYGVVDAYRISRESKLGQQSANELQAYQKSLVGTLRRLSQGSAPFLSTNEITELAGLYQKESPTATEQKRIGELEGKGDQLKREATNLQSVASPTDAQSARFAALNDTVTQGNIALKNLEDSFNNLLRQRVQDADRKTQTAIRTATTKVAKQKNLAAVFAADIAIYADVDITEDVIKDLNQ